MAGESFNWKSSPASPKSKLCKDNTEDLPTVADVWGGSCSSNINLKPAHTDTDGESSSNEDKTENVEDVQIDSFERPNGVIEDTLDLFGKYLISILRQLPTSKSYHLQQKFINEAIDAKLLCEIQHPGKLCPNEYQPAKVPEDVATQDCTVDPSSSSTVNSYTDTPVTSSRCEPIPEVNIKIEVPDEMDISEETTHIDVDRVNEGSSHTEVEERKKLVEVKNEIISPFELVYCNSIKKMKKGEHEDRLVSSVDQLCRSHVSQDQEVRGFPCGLCPIVSSSSQELTSHLKIKHPAVKGRHPRCFYCPVRKNRFTPCRCHTCSRPICKEHTGSTTYKCNACFKIRAE